MQRLRNHVQKVAGRYQVRIDDWDFINEAVLDEGCMLKSKWYELVGEDYVQKAFQYEDEAAPGAELYYNDYNLQIPEKREAEIELVKSL